MSGESRDKKRKRKYYQASAAGGKRGRHRKVLEPGMTGFLITCNQNQGLVVREAYSLLNEYADKLYGAEQESHAGSSGGEEEEEDVEAALQKEVSALQAARPAQRRFNVVDTSANNCLFIQSSLPDPYHLAHALLADLYQHEVPKSRFVLRLMPVAGTCRAGEEAMRRTAEAVLGPFFTAPTGRTYSILFKVRNNNSVSRNTVLPLIGRVVADLNPASRVNLSNPEVVINIDIIRTVCCISALEDFYKFRKYNVQEVPGAKKLEKQKLENQEASSESQKGQTGDESKAVETVDTEKSTEKCMQNELDNTEIENTKSCSFHLEKGDLEDENSSEKKTDLSKLEKSESQILDEQKKETTGSCVS